ncbi:MAG: hypothetical protein LBT59_08370 [Clostridiales bacterium]|nr:hypothetical protein [Clostridiales bacterium]
MKKKALRSTIQAVSSKTGLDIYLNFEGTHLFLTSHSKDNRLYSLLKDGMTIRDLSKIKSTDKRRWVNYSAAHLLKIVDGYFEELDA